MSEQADDKGGPSQLYRFRVRTADGRELISQVAEVPLPWPLQSPQWGQPRMAPGDKVKLNLVAQGRDGQSIPIVVERNTGAGTWEALGGVVGKVESGKIEAEFLMPRLPPIENKTKGAMPITQHQLRFRAKADDGLEVTSAIAALDADDGKGKGKLSAAHFAHAQYLAGDEAVLSVHALDLDGKPVRLVIEQEKEGKWETLAEVRATAKAGLASTAWGIPPTLGQPAAAKEGEKAEPKPVKLRLHALAGFASSISEPVSVTPSVGALKNPQWAQAHPDEGARFVHGDEAGMRVEAPGLDGRKVRFVIEERNGANWSVYDTVMAEVKGGVAVAAVKAQHPAVARKRGGKTATTPAHKPGVLRFRAELT